MVVLAKERPQDLLKRMEPVMDKLKVLLDTIEKQMDYVSHQDLIDDKAYYAKKKILDRTRQRLYPIQYDFYDMVHPMLNPKKEWYD